MIKLEIEMTDEDMQIVTQRFFDEVFMPYVRAGLAPTCGEKPFEDVDDSAGITCPFKMSEHLIKKLYENFGKKIDDEYDEYKDKRDKAHLLEIIAYQQKEITKLSEMNAYFRTKYGY